MSQLAIEGFEVEVSQTGAEIDEVPWGDFGRAFSGRMRSDVRAHHEGLRLRTAELTVADADALRLILKSPGPLSCSGELVGTASRDFHATGVRVTPVTGTHRIVEFDLRATRDNSEAELLFSFDGDAEGTYTFTRTGTAYYIDSDGVLQSAAANEARFSWPLVDGVRTPSLLLEKAATNDLLDSADIDGGVNWTETGTWVQTAATSIIDGQAANRQTNDNGAANRNIRQSTPNLVASPIVLSFIVENVDALTTVVGLRDDTAGGWVVQATYTWATGAVVVTDDGAGSATGARAITLSESGPNGGKVVRIEAWGTADNATNSGTARIYPTGLDQNALAAILHHAQHENGTVATSPIVTTSSAGTRNVDTLYVPYAHAPQESTGYVKLVEGGTDNDTATDRIFQIGSATATDDPRFTVFSSSGGGYRASYDDGVAAVTSPAVLTRPSAGDVVELVPFLHVDDEDNVTVSIQQSINGGAAEDSGVSPSSAKLKNAYAAQRIYLNSAGSTGHGAVSLISIKHAAGTKTLAEMRALSAARLHPRTR